MIIYSRLQFRILVCGSFVPLNTIINNVGHFLWTSYAGQLGPYFYIFSHFLVDLLYWSTWTIIITGYGHFLVDLLYWSTGTIFIISATSLGPAILVNWDHNYYYTATPLWAYYTGLQGPS